MKNIIFSFIALMFVGCAKQNVLKIDPRLKPYYQSFLSESEIRGQNNNKGNLIIEIGPTRQGVVAYCQRIEETYFHNGVITKKYGVIRFGEEYWNEYNKPCQNAEGKIVNCNLRGELSIKQTMNHELGHCVLNLGHNDSVAANGYPQSIMNSWEFASWMGTTYLAYEKFYLDQLFGIRRFAFIDQQTDPVAKTTAFIENKIYETKENGCEDHHIHDEEKHEIINRIESLEENMEEP